LALDRVFVVVRHETLGTRLDPLNSEPHSPMRPMPVLRQLALGCFEIMSMNAHPSITLVVAGAPTESWRAMRR
jgi:hypothetical protein